MEIYWIPTKVFKKYCKACLKIYICRRRIENAKYMLENTELPIIEIATKNGFENVTYFNRRFKEFVGITPTEYYDSYPKNSLTAFKYPSTSIM